VPVGTYVVQLKFAEIYGWKVGQRIFDVHIEGRTVLASFDLIATAGRFTAYDRTFTVEVTDGTLDITFAATTESPKINAIRVIGGPAAPLTATPTSTAATATTTPARTATATATPTPSATRPPTSYDVAVNCGGAAYTARDGKLWQGDQAYTVGSWGYSGGKAYAASVPIAGTDDDILYQSEHYGASVYRFDVAPGIYAVQLKFAEIYASKVGQRIFDVQIEGMAALSALDLFAVAGRYTAYDRTFTVEVTDGILDIAFIARVNQPKINAIRVTAVGP
jgi:hypothetical protein